jgi:hypothetical protein
MRLPVENAAYEQLVRFGCYVARSLHRKKLTQLAQDTESANQKVKELGRAWTDAAEPVQVALSDRDGADDDLDSLAKTMCRNLAERSPDAAKKEPYTKVFSEGIEYFTAAPIDENKTRYQELHTRLDTNLAPDDPLRAKLVELTDLIAVFNVAYAATKEKMTALTVARDELAQALTSWRAYMERLYETLTSMEDKAFAEKFFPKASRRSKDDTE